MSTSQQQRLEGNVQITSNGASNKIIDTVAPSQPDQSKEISSRRASQPLQYEAGRPTLIDERRQPEIYEDQQQAMQYETQQRVVQSDQEQFLERVSEDQGVSSPVRENDSQTCSCYQSHDVGTNSCNCSCHESIERTRTLSIEKRRRSSLMTPYDTENQSPLSSIRSLESTIKDSGFSDDVERGHREDLTSSDGANEFSDSESNRGKRKRKHVARYIVSSGVAETFRLDEDDEEDDSRVVIKPRSSSLPHLKKRDDKIETCPRLLNRPTITKEVQRSLKK